MIRPEQVAARVADLRQIRWLDAPPMKYAAVDANALYFAYYPNFRRLRDSGGPGATRDQTNVYPNWLGKLRRDNTPICTSTEAFGEFVKTMERSELMIEALLKLGEPVDPHNFDPKAYRYHERIDIAVVRSAVAAYAASARKLLTFLPNPNSDNLHTTTMYEWHSSLADVADSSLIASAKLAGVMHIIGDDQDMASFGGITFYTANRHAIAAAEVAGMLLDPPEPVDD
jgi:hypothetical protein